MDGKSMRYNHESYLPIGAFQPILGRMTLHGGGGGFISDFVDSVSDFIAPVTDVINDVIIQPASDVFAASDDYITQPITAPISQLTSALDDAVIQPITEPISDVGVAIDDAVAEVIPGGWGTIAQVAAAVATAGQSTLVQAAAAAAAAGGSKFQKDKDLKSALEAAAIAGGTAGVTQGVGKEFGLGNLGKAGLSAGLSGGVDYAKTGDINSALRAGAQAGAMSYGGAKLGEYTAPYFNELKGDFGKYLQEKGLNLSKSAIPSTVNLDPDLGMPGEVSGPQNFYPDAAPALSGELQMTDSGEFINKNPDIQNTDFIPKKIELTPDLRIREDILNQANLDAAYTPDSQYINQDAQGYDKIKFKDDPYRYLASRGVEGKDYVINKATGAVDYLTDTPLSQMPGDLYNKVKDLKAKDLALLGTAAYGLSSLGGGSEQGKSQAQIDEEEEAKRVYTYGTSTPSGSNYLLKNRINADNVYSNAAGYRPLNRYADGGDVQNYGIGGRVSDAFTRVAQPFEKAVLRPIGEAVPFIKDLAPYAGIAAGAMMGNPAMAAGIGGIASGFGKPGGFDMKRALMGGIAAYGMSNLVGGLEAAGQTPLTDSAALPFESYPDPQNQAGGFYGPSGQTNQLPATNQTFRSPEAVQKGIGNLLENSNTPAYKNAMSTFTKNAGIYNAGVPLIMGTTGMMGVDEGNALKQEYDSSLMAQQAEEANFNARILAGKKRAQQAVSENPYRFAMGGAIDDEYGGDNMNTVNGNMQNGFISYADGGPVTNKEDIDYMVQIENNRREVDPMSDERYAGLLKQNQDYLSTKYGNIYNQPTPQPVAPPVTVAPSVEPTPLTGAVAPPPPPPPPPPTVAPPPLDIETVRANANRALDMSEEVQNNIRDSSRAVEKAQELIGTASATPPPPVYKSPNATPAGQYMVRNPYGPEPLNAANIYEYQKKKQRGYAEGGIPRFLSGGGDGMSDSIKANIEGTQEARLADGEFVIPADVVSHLGNGSSKAGAKQLYDMMDRVRKARTGNQKQGRQIKPTKLMPV